MTVCHLSAATHARAYTQIWAARGEGSIATGNCFFLFVRAERSIVKARGRKQLNSLFVCVCERACSFPSWFFSSRDFVRVKCASGWTRRRSPCLPPPSRRPATCAWETWRHAARRRLLRGRAEHIEADGRVLGQLGKSCLCVFVFVFFLDALTVVFTRESALWQVRGVDCELSVDAHTWAAHISENMIWLRSVDEPCEASSSHFSWWHHQMSVG